MSRRGLLAAGAGVAATGALLARRAKRVSAYPPGPDAITAEGARAHVESLAEKAALSRTDLAMTFAPAIATSVEPLLHGHRYFPRMLEDIDGRHATTSTCSSTATSRATSGRRSWNALAAKVAEGVEVLLEVDAIGSEVDFGSKDLFGDLIAAGIKVVAHDGLFVVRTGPSG